MKTESNFYILDDNNEVIGCNTFSEVRNWIDSLPEELRTGVGRKVDSWHSKDREIQVSTVFMAMDHGFGEKSPQVFETMIFGGEDDEKTTRYSSWTDAVRGHKLIVSKYSITEVEGEQDEGNN